MFEAISSYDARIYEVNATDVARNLAASHEGTLQLAPMDTDDTKFPHRHPYEYYVAGKPLEPTVLATKAEMVQPQYPQMRQSLAEDPSTAEYIEASLDILEDDDILWIWTPQGDITDIVLAKQAVAEQLYERGQKFTPKAQSIIASKSIPEVECILPNGEPVDSMTVLRSVYSHIFLAWPTRTDTTWEALSKLPETVVKSQHRAMKSALVTVLGRGGVLGTVSPTDSIHRKADEEARLWLPRIDDATLDVISLGNTAESRDKMKGKRSYVLPVATWSEGDEPFMRIIDWPTAITFREQAHSLMAKMVAAMTEAVPDKTFGYREAA